MLQARLAIMSAKPAFDTRQPTACLCSYGTEGKGAVGSRKAYRGAGRQL